MVILTTEVCTHQSVLVPGHASLLVGIGVGVALGRAGLAAEETVQVGADLVGTTSLDGVALSTAGLEQLGALSRVTWSEERISWLWLGGGCWAAGGCCDCWSGNFGARKSASSSARFLLAARSSLTSCTKIGVIVQKMSKVLMVAGAQWLTLSMERFEWM
jgi:hypothetical protein